MLRQIAVSLVVAAVAGGLSLLASHTFNGGRTRYCVPILGRYTLLCRAPEDARRYDRLLSLPEGSNENSLLENGVVILIDIQEFAVTRSIAVFKSRHGFFTPRGRFEGADYALIVGGSRDSAPRFLSQEELETELKTHGLNVVRFQSPERLRLVNSELSSRPWRYRLLHDLGGLSDVIWSELVMSSGITICTFLSALTLKPRAGFTCLAGGLLFFVASQVIWPLGGDSSRYIAGILVMRWVVLPAWVVVSILAAKRIGRMLKPRALS